MIVDIDPVRSGTVRREGQRIHWQEFGTGEECLLLLPTWSIVHSDFWRHQVRYFAGKRRVVTFDGLGNGASDRPTDPSLYGDLDVAGDAIAVLDAAGVERAAIAGSSQGGPWALATAAQHPDRVSAAVFIAPNVPLAPGHPARVAANVTFEDETTDHSGWGKWNRSYWLAHFPDFLEYFFSQCFTEPDSAEQIEHFLGMGLETTAEVLLATGGDGRGAVTEALARELAGSVRCRSLVIHGDQDAITPLARGRELARLIDAELVVLPGSGHEPHVRDPDSANQLIERFLDQAP